MPELCEAGQLCAVTESPFSISNSACPAGYYCTQGITTAAACTNLDTTLCPSGSRFEGGQNVECAAGYYLSGSTCKYCDKGYVCTGNATVSNPNSTAEGGYICPRGYYCDSEISVSEIACPIGTYNNFLGKGYSTDCHPCNANYYQNQIGQRTCIECGNGAISNANATTCTCGGDMKFYDQTQNQ